jgi:hypothetical protein
MDCQECIACPFCLRPVGDRQRLSGLVAGREEPPPAADNLFVGPGLGRIRVQPHQQVQVIIHHAEPTDGKGEDVRKFLEPMFDPGFTVLGLVP